MFINEDNAFRLTGHQQSFKKSTSNESSTFYSNNTTLETMTINFDSPFTDFTRTISKCLYKGTYSQSPSFSNPFCPLCSKYVNENENFTRCDITGSQAYLIHDKCLCADSSFGMNLAAEEQDDMLILKNDHFKKQYSAQSINKNIGIQLREFLVEIIFYHPISEKKFGKIQKKIRLSKQKNIFQLNLTDTQNQDQFSPNMLVLPLTDYKIDINIHEIGEENRTKVSKYVNLKKIPANNVKQMIFGNKQLQLQIDVYTSPDEKEKILESMNYKYVFPVAKLPIIVVQTLWLPLPQIFKEDQSSSYDQIMESSSSKLLEFLDLDEKPEQEKSLPSRRTSKSNISIGSLNSKKSETRQMKKYQGLPTQIGDSEKVNLQKLIKNDGLKSFVMHNTQSRSFQSFLQKADIEEIDTIIQHLKSEFVDLMKHEYGNYMMQKLFSVCNLERRVQILEVLTPQLSEIVMSKQGTHAFQEFISFFTTDQEYSLVLNKIKQNFYELCTDNNATHFIQKIVKLFPMQLLNQFFYYCVQNIYQFGCDKNGMCVLKYMLKKLRELSDLTFDKSPKHQQCLELVQQYKKLFVQATLYNLDAMIGDMYGNYVVQFHYELFESGLTSMLTDSILIRLPQYSLSKYSTNVVFKCLNAYWIDQKQYVSSVLKEVFQPYLILEMYKNKDGNKILLEIMDKYEGLQVWNRLYNVLINTEPTRFYHDRWGTCLGIRSGNVGGNWNSFTEAVQKLNPKRKNKKLF